MIYKGSDKVNVYVVTSENIHKCNDCRKDIDKFNRFYMITFAQNKNNGLNVYLCEECKDKLKGMLD